jgi:hypothetical protein
MPGFLKRAEQKLFLNKPLIWSTRVHLVLYYGVLYNLFLAGLSFLAPMNFMRRSNSEYWVGFQIIIAIIAFTVWLIYLLRFNVFKKYGNVKPFHALVTFLLCFISTGIIVLSVYIYPIVECVRANMAYSDKTLVQDINNMNIKICQLEHKVLNRKWNYDTVYVVKDKKNGGYNPQHQTYDTRPYDHALIMMDTATFKDRLAYTDSLVKLNDSLYLFYKTPELQFVFFYRIREYGKEKLLSSFEIYNRALRHPPTDAEVRTIAKELNELERKYGNHHKSDYVTYDDSDLLPGDAPYEAVRKRHPVSDINSNISSIASTKYSFSGRQLAQYIRLFYYFTLGITLLIFIFRHTTVRAFFLSLLSGVLLTILTVMVLAFWHAGVLTFISSMIAYTLVFFMGSAYTFSAAKRNVLNGIFINLFVFIIPVFPVLLVEFIYESYRIGTNIAPDMGRYFLFAEIGGAVLLLVLLATYINRVYRRWYSLPEN